MPSSPRLLLTLLLLCSGTALARRAMETKYSPPHERIRRTLGADERFEDLLLPAGSEVQYSRIIRSLTFTSPGLTPDGKELRGPYSLLMDLDLSGVPPASIEPGARVKGFFLPPDVQIEAAQSLLEARLGGTLTWKGTTFAPGTQLWFTSLEGGPKNEELLISQALLAAEQEVDGRVLPAGTTVTFRNEPPGKLERIKLNGGVIELEGCKVTDSATFTKFGEVLSFTAAEPCHWQDMEVQAGQYVVRRPPLTEAPVGSQLPGSSRASNDQGAAGAKLLPGLFLIAGAASLKMILHPAARGATLVTVGLIALLLLLLHRRIRHLVPLGLIALIVGPVLFPLLFFIGPTRVNPSQLGYYDTGGLLLLLVTPLVGVLLSLATVLAYAMASRLLRRQPLPKAEPQSKAGSLPR